MGRVVLGLLLALLFATPAQATFHLMKVNEVGLSVGGAQYVELLDPGEPFPPLFAPYRLVIHNADGSQAGQQTIDGSALAGRSTPILVADQPTVNGQARDIALTAGTLPANGQACFFGNNSNVHCLRWGTITNPQGPGVTGPAPGDGQSVELCGSSAQVGAPTPKTTNGCASGGGGGGGAGGGGTTDTTRPLASVTRAVQTLEAVLRRGYRFRLRSNENGRAVAQLLRRGRVVATKRAGLSAGVPKLITLRLAAGAARALRGLESTTLALRVQVFDRAGNRRTITRRVRLR